MISGLALAMMLRSCAPQSHPQTMAAIISVESRNWPWTLHDNTTDREYYEPSYGEAVQLGMHLIATGDSVDLGIAQINSKNLAGYGLTVAEVMNPCINIHTGASILYSAYNATRRHFGDAWVAENPTLAAWHAVSAYNTGSLFTGGRYVARVVAAAQKIGEIPTFSYPLLTAPPQTFVQARLPVRAVAPPAPTPTPRKGMVITMMPSAVEPDRK